MKENKIYINGKPISSEKDTDQIKNKNSLTEKPMEEHAPELIQIDENVWGTDLEFEKKLEEQFLADRRLFVRVRYFAEVLCNKIYRSGNDEPEVLPYPFSLSIIDISSGGIGAISDEEIEIDSVLPVKLVLEKIEYIVRYRVVYCIPHEGKYRIGLKLNEKNNIFKRHLKIYIAKLSLQLKQ